MAAPHSPAGGPATGGSEETRPDLAAELLWGDGLQVGPPRRPTPLLDGSSIRHVEADDSLDSVAGESLDFLIADQPPEGRAEMVATHLSKLRPGGILFYSDADAPMLDVERRVDGVEIEAIRQDGHGTIVVMRKEGGDARPAASGDPPAPQLPAPVAPPATTVVGAHSRIPLAALRARRIPRDGAIHWSVDPDGAIGRGLVQSVMTRYAIPLSLSRSARLQTRIQLLPHNWRDGLREVRAAIDGVGPDGVQRLWESPVRTALAGGEQSGEPIDCELPAGLTELVLVMDPPRVREPLSAALAVWMDPVIVDPRTPPSPRPVVPSAPPSRGIAPAGDRPLFSVLTPVHDPPLHMLREAVESVRRQSSGSWELCLVDDGSSTPQVIEALRGYADTDPRIHLERRESAGGISVATNAAMAMASGEYVALLDHDDLLVPNALELVEQTLAADPGLDMVYSDEAVVVDGRRVTQILKPGWSPESFACHMYACHLGVYRRSIAAAIGGFRSQYDGCQDYDFVLRFTEQTDRVAHIPAQLYHWRAHTASTAGGGEAKPYAYLAQPPAIAEHLGRLGVEAEVRFGSAPGLHRIAHRVAPDTIASALCVVDDPTLAARLVLTMGEQSHPGWKLVLGTPRSRSTAIRVALEPVDEVTRSRVELVELGDDVPMPQALAALAARASGDVVLALEGPIAGLTHDWLATLAGWARHPGVAAAGALVLDLDGRIADAGYAFPEGIALPLLGGLDNAQAATVTLNVSAAGGVLATPRRVIDELGLDPGWGDLMLVDYCLRAGSAGLRTVVSPDARVQLTSRRLPGGDVDALWRLRDAWAGRPADPLYNINFRPDLADFSPRQRL